MIKGSIAKRIEHYENVLKHQSSYSESESGVMSLEEVMRIEAILDNLYEEYELYCNFVNNSFE